MTAKAAQAKATHIKLAEATKATSKFESVEECLDQLESTLAALEQRLKPVLIPKSVEGGVKASPGAVRAPVADRIGRIDTFVSELMERIEL